MQACEASNSFPCWGKALALNPPAVAAAVNTGSVVDDIAPGNPRTLDALTFGEAAIDMQAAGIFIPGVCRNFGRAYLKSRSSDSFNSEIKDFIAPIAINVSNCTPRTIPNRAKAKASNFAPAGGNLGDWIVDAGSITVTETALLFGAPAFRLAGSDVGSLNASSVFGVAESSAEFRLQSMSLDGSAGAPWPRRFTFQSATQGGTGQADTPSPARLMT
jgi:hypothetical protein